MEHNQYKRNWMIKCSRNGFSYVVIVNTTEERLQGYMATELPEAEATVFPSSLQPTPPGRVTHRNLHGWPWISPPCLAVSQLTEPPGLWLPFWALPSAPS